MFGKLEIEIFWIDEFIALRSKDYPFIIDDRNTNKLNVIPKSQSKNLKLENKQSV